MEKTISHNWTKETMDKCRETFMDYLTWYQLCFTDGDWKTRKISSLIEQYYKIECDVKNNG